MAAMDVIPNRLLSYTHGKPDDLTLPRRSCAILCSSSWDYIAMSKNFEDSSAQTDSGQAATQASHKLIRRLKLLVIGTHNIQMFEARLFDTQLSQARELTINELGRIPCPAILRKRLDPTTHMKLYMQTPNRLEMSKHVGVLVFVPTTLEHPLLITSVLTARDILGMIMNNRNLCAEEVEGIPDELNL